MPEDTVVSKSVVGQLNRNLKKAGGGSRMFEPSADLITGLIIRVCVWVFCFFFKLNLYGLLCCHMTHTHRHTDTK